MATGTLFVVATPLGNRLDLTPRAADLLRTAPVIAAEDTRTARRLLAELGVALGERRLISCFDANESGRASELAATLAQGGDVVLVSDAGTPLVSDPGFRVVAAAIAVGARVVPVPGASALLAALVGAGLPTDRFVFLGFPPRKSGARRRLFETLRALPFTLVFYESPMRTGATLEDLAAVLGGGRPACVARELTKEHEEFVRGPLADLAARYRDERPLGEVTLVVAGVDETATDEDSADDDLAARADALLAEGLSVRDVADQLAAATGRPRRAIYQLVVKRQTESKKHDAL
ncbi:MAG TPA: 16S rRNA (cytidine(1402)-2'-O)-methyltransferase [Polyangia bacterium]|nr:16S rRNA (cytidine(1402)-2'-O)-methyltransferase [Polyangia bacterium]